MSFNDQLRSMYSEEQLASLDKVRQVLKDDPKALDTHSREKRNAEGSAENSHAR